MPPVPTLAEMRAACAQNRDVSEQQAQRMRQFLEREGPGLQRDRMLCDLSRHIAEYEHWASYVQYYAARVSAEGPDVRPKLTWVQDSWKPARRPAPVAHDPRLPREREDDTEEALPF